MHGREGQGSRGERLMSFCLSFFQRVVGEVRVLSSNCVMCPGQGEAVYRRNRVVTKFCVGESVYAGMVQCTM